MRASRARRQRAPARSRADPPPPPSLYVIGGLLLGLVILVTAVIRSTTPAAAAAVDASAQWYAPLLSTIYSPFYGALYGVAATLFVFGAVALALVGLTELVANRNAKLFGGARV